MIFRAAKEGLPHPPGCICIRCGVVTARRELDRAREQVADAAQYIRDVAHDLDSRGKLLAVRRELLLNGLRLQRSARLLLLRQEAAPAGPAPSDPYRGGVPVEAKPHASGRRSWWRRVRCALGAHGVDGSGKGDIETRAGVLTDLDVEICACGAWRIVAGERRFSWHR